ncbi:DEAD/DEAH box helicase [Flavobacterium sp.]|uniref:DEAD/DEAH box helicase n=1 Tax=Flavobacterium sp. TaxID=239 RepID=UPI00120AF83F|nr:DEAD/DEAH box helicase [Flavobacterium sp.]RZJ72560.1 MAG: DEAD/DEAH box helicase [Flavobacterium sp.]
MASSASVKPYRHQERDISRILKLISQHGSGYNALYQLPTGGGKTVIFCELAKRYLEQFGRRVAILTHRIELCAQTGRTLKNAGVESYLLTSDSLSPTSACSCMVAMVETLKNRIRDKEIDVTDVGLVIIDEAHNNSFHKLLDNFPNAFIVGATATPLSSDGGKPMKDTYDELIVGESIAALVDANFLAKPKSVSIPVDLNGLAKGSNGDYTISSSDALYSLPAMQQTLFDAYKNNCVHKKTLIFNNGIATSLKVHKLFEDQGCDIRHLDNRTSEKEREEILKWFKKTRGAILTSVSILTTGFDEPSVQALLLNRATTSMTLYHQMVGRGARWLANKKTFTIVDLGNNIERFGNWNDFVDWQFVFDDPESFIAQLESRDEHTSPKTGITADARAQFANSANVSFDIAKAFLESGDSHKDAIKNSIRQHAAICLENAESLSHALKLAETLKPDIELRVKEYVKLLDNSTKSFKDWLTDDYVRRLDGLVKRFYGAKSEAFAD